MKVEIYIATNSDICINAQYKNSITDYTKSDILAKTLVLLPVDWDKNSLICIYKAAPCDEQDYWLFIGKNC